MDNILFYTSKRLVLPFVLACTLMCFAAKESIADPLVKERVSVPFSELAEAEVLTRMENMGCLIPVKLTKEVRDQIHRYTEAYKKGSGDILGRAEMYFPLFDQYFAEAGLPDQLKYLSIVESALNPEAMSSAGAAGLWQFMRTTGRYYGLEINRVVDQRKDPHLSTQAAALYLKDLHKSFGDWSLALAAYNSGPSRVRAAMRQANSSDFWAIKNYLPRETRNYVPAFIAATYLANYYYLHGIEPALLRDEMVFTTSVKVYEELNFRDIAGWTELPADLIQKLNPSYLRHLIPESVTGNMLTLPNTHMIVVLEKLKRPDDVQWVGPRPLNIQPHDEEFIQVRSIEMPVVIRMETYEPLQSIDPIDWTAQTIASIEANASSPKPQRNNTSRVEPALNFTYYRIRKGQSLNEIAQKKGIPVEDLISWNEHLLKSSGTWHGAYIKLPELH
jgi:membrane-bound lytic murein transglycosylase D